MSAVLTPPREGGRAERHAVADAATLHAHAPAAVGPTLDEAASALWAGLLAGDAVACPVCGTAMRPRHSAGAGVVGGRCGGCSVSLS
jgi:hypothetical protein